MNRALGQGPRLGFLLEPQVNRVAADTEEFTDFTFFVTLKLDRIDHFLTKVVTIVLWHSYIQKKILVYPLS